MRGSKGVYKLKSYDARWVGEAPSIRSREDQSVNKFGVLATKTRSLVAVSWRGRLVPGGWRHLVSSVTACALAFIFSTFFSPL